MSTPSNSKTFHVLIAGGGIAGLALALSLEKAGITYTLLERRSTIAPKLGASININPAGARILDQLGCYDDLLASGVVHEWVHDCTRDGRMIGPACGAPGVIRERLGYGLLFDDRHAVLSIMYRHLTEKSRVSLDKSIERVDLRSDGVSVVCEDGSRYYGNVLIGCDRVNSKVRHEMWRLADELSPGCVSKEDKTAMFCEYQCLLGVASGMEGMPEPNVYRVGYGKDANIISCASRDGRIYWFMLKKLDRVYKTHEITRYTQEDAERLGEEFGDFRLDSNWICRDLIAHSKSIRLVPLEEGQFRRWTFGPIACCGDSIHKMLPAAGAGGNTAIESAAVIANELRRLLDGQTPGYVPTQAAIAAALQRYQNQRRSRASQMCQMSDVVAYMQALRTKLYEFAVFYVAPKVPELIADMGVDLSCGAAMLEFIPPPLRSLSGSMPFNPRSGAGQRESSLWRLVLGLPMLLISVVALNIMTVEGLRPHLMSISQEGVFQTTLNSSIPLLKTFTGIRALDDFVRPFTIAFMPATTRSDILSSMQSRSFMLDCGVVYTILLFESSRRCNYLTLAKVPIIFGLFAQLRGIGVAAGFWFWLFYATSQTDNFKALDSRLFDRRYSQSIIWAMLIAFYIPAILQYTLGLTAGQTACWLWQSFPITVAAAIQRLAKSLGESRRPSSRAMSLLSQLKPVMVSMALVGLISACMWLWTWATNPHSMMETFVPASLIPLNADVVTGMRLFLQWDETLTFATCFLWLAYSFWDLEAAGMLFHSWSICFVFGIFSMFVFGPGAMLAIGWLYRESCFTFRRHKDAVVAKRDRADPPWAQIWRCIREY